MAQGIQDDWNFLWLKYKNETIAATEQIVILKALGCTKDGNQTIVCILIFLFFVQGAV